MGDDNYRVPDSAHSCPHGATGLRHTPRVVLHSAFVCTVVPGRGAGGMTRLIRCLWFVRGVAPCSRGVALVRVVWF